MKVFKLIYVLYKMRLLSPRSFYRLAAGVYKYGINLMTLLHFVERTYGDKTALVDDYETLSYRELYFEVEKLSRMFSEKYQLKPGGKAGFMCKNHGSLVKAIFAASLLGVDIYLLNAEMGSGQFEKILERHDFDLLVYDFELCPLIEGANYRGNAILSYHDSLPSVNNLLREDISFEVKLQRTSMGKLVLLTGGTTGSFKEAAHKPSMFNYLNPFVTLLTRLKLLEYDTAYIATPIYHGYGVAVLLLFMALGKKAVVTRGFEAQRACRIIKEHGAEVVTVVPLMLYKMLRCNPEDLKSLCCIASGGAELNPKLIEDTFEKLGDVLYNLYGTSEAGLNIVATPQDLRYSANTIGRKIDGMGLRVMDSKGTEVEDGKIGQFCVKNNWSMKNRKSSWIETGDLGYRDSKGYYFLCGRRDDMIVSAGENVYPIEVEKVLIKHPQVEDVAVIGIRDETFGQRLKAYVQPANNSSLTKEELLEWLKSRVARFQMPKEIAFLESMPYTPLGKLDKKQLIEL